MEMKLMHNHKQYYVELHHRTRPKRLTINKSGVSLSIVKTLSH